MTIKFHYLFVALLPVLAIVAFEFCLSYFVVPRSLGFEPALFAGSSSTMLAIETGLRLKMVALMAALCSYAVFVVSYVVRDTFSQFKLTYRNQLLLLCSLLSVIPPLILYLSVDRGITSSESYLGSDVFVRAFAAIENIKDKFYLTENTLWCMRNLPAIIVGVAIAAIITSAISCLGETSTTNTAAKSAHWKMQQRLQLLIYVSTALLVIGVLFMQSWTNWPTFVFAAGTKDMPNAALAAYSQVQSSFVIYNGIEYSVLLASIVVPISYILDSRANEIARGELQSNPPLGYAPTSDNAASLGFVAVARKTNDLYVSLLDQVKAILAILAPFLTGSLGDIFGFILGKH